MNNNVTFDSSPVFRDLHDSNNKVNNFWLTNDFFVIVISEKNIAQ